MSIIGPDLYQLIEKHVSDLHGVQIYGQVVEPIYSQVKNRIALIFALESVLDDHRQKYATEWSPLIGRQALEHLLLKKYQWPLTIIRELNLKDIVLCLQEELELNNLPNPGKATLDLYYPFPHKQFFPDFQEEEWDPDLYLKLPERQRW